VPNAVQRRAVQQVRELGFVQRLAFAHSTKAAGSTVDLVLWNMAHTLNTSMFVRPEHNWAEVQRLQGVHEQSTGGRFWFSTELPRMVWNQKMAPDVFQFLMLRHPLDRCESYYYYRQGDPRNRFKFMQNLSFTEFLKETAHPRHRKREMSCTNFYFRQLRDNPHASLSDVRETLRSRFVFVGLASRFQESMFMLARLVGWPTNELPENFVSANVNEKHLSQAKAPISASTKKWFAEHNRNDIVLWEEAQRIWSATFLLFEQADGEAFTEFRQRAGLPVEQPHTNA